MTLALAPLPQRVARNASLEDLVGILQAQARQTLDLVVPASTIRFNGGNLELSGVDPILNEHGVLDPSGLYRPTRAADVQVGTLFGIPTHYVRKLRDEFVALLDTNINEWSAHEAYDSKKVLVRLLWGTDPEDPTVNGVLRAVLSDRYGARDNLDTLVAVLDGMREAGLSANDLRINGDLTDNKMYVTVNAPEIKGYGHKLLEGYRSPFANGRGTGHGGLAAENLPIVQAGLIVRNSETGGGAQSVTPRLTVLACSNGLQITKDALSKIHLGAKLDEGAVVWSNETRQAANQLAKEQVKDAVKSFLNATYVQKVIDELEQVAVVEVQDVPKTIEVVAKQLAYTETEAKGILDHFIKGGQVTAGGILQAVTSWTQEIEDPDRAFEFEASGLKAMEVAAALNRV